MESALKSAVVVVVNKRTKTLIKNVVVRKIKQVVVVSGSRGCIKKSCRT